MEKILEGYGSYLLMQASLPALEKEMEAKRRHSLALDRERSQRKVEWEGLKDPGFFRRLLGRVEEKQEAAYRTYQEAELAWKQGCRAFDQAVQAYERANSQLDALSAAPAAYEALPKTQQVREAAVEAFRMAALYNLERALSSLNQALQWEYQERNTAGRLPNQDDGMWEQLTAAKEPARQLKYILEQFPEPDSWLCDYLRNPDGFVYDGVIMKISPRNQIRIAIGQLERLEGKLK